LEAVTINAQEVKFVHDNEYKISNKMKARGQTETKGIRSAKDLGSISLPDDFEALA
jgi:hypothetical protein